MPGARACNWVSETPLIYLFFVFLVRVAVAANKYSVCIFTVRANEQIKPAGMIRENAQPCTLTVQHRVERSE